MTLVMGLIIMFIMMIVINVVGADPQVSTDLMNNLKP